jgi:soluble lytic murein transglycosylase-like protein
VRTESSGLAHRISPTGAMGPAQLTWATARTLGVDDPFAPAEATAAGARYLSQLLARHPGQRALAVAAYNAGPHAVTDAIPRNGETELYVPRVLALEARLHAAHARPPRRATAGRH